MTYEVLIPTRNLILDMDGDDDYGEAEAVQVLTQASNVCAFLNSLEEVLQELFDSVVALTSNGDV